jgi:hypothetical protein
MEYFERYLGELQNSFTEINYVSFGVNLLVTAILTTLLGLFYVRFGNAISNRRRFARIFMPLALTTMLIIFIVKSSVALSLGLVGALSIVRFRAAVKDPEELTFLFLAIGLGLAAGADEIIIAICAFIFILALLFAQAMLRKRSLYKSADNMHLNLSTSHRDLAAITKVLSDNFPFVELKRIDDSGKQLDLSYVIDAQSIMQIDAARNQLAALAPDMVLSFVEQRNIAV